MNQSQDKPRPPTHSSIERGIRLAEPVDDEWGRSESLDPDNVGDIADEGARCGASSTCPVR